MENIWIFLRALKQEWSKDQIPRQSAAIAYYSIFSLPSLLIVLIAIAGALLGNDVVEQQVFDSIDNLVAGPAADALKVGVQGAARAPKSAVMTLIGLGLMLLAATAVLRQLQASLDAILGGVKSKHAGLMDIAKRYLLPLILVIFAAVLLLFSVVMTALLSIANERAAAWINLPASLLNDLNTLFSLVFLTFAFFILYRALPAKRLAVFPTFVGSIATTLLFGLGRYGLGVYFQSSSVGAAYGVAASVLILLVWIYYSAHIFLLGAEIIDILSNWKEIRKRLKKS